MNWINHATLTQWAELFEIVTPLVLLIWFLFAQWTQGKIEYFKEVPGHYGGYTNLTNRKSIKGEGYGAGLTMEIFNVDSNGYFRGQLEYYVWEAPASEASQPPPPWRLVQASINFVGGKLSYRWNFPFFKRRNPLLWNTNRIYKGTVNTVERLDILADSEVGILERKYKMKHFRETQVLKFTLVSNLNDLNYLPESITLFKTSNHLMDPLKSIRQTVSNLHPGR